ncbi:DUF4371 domain-containing protein [Citrus sinensis]|nr:DUF4371 domain-containing protein [Citrus sinensis]
MAKPQKTLDAFFKRKDSSESPTSLTPCQINVEHSTLAQEQRPPKSPRIESRKDDNLNSLQRDPGLRQQIWNYLVNERDEIRRAYIKAGPYHVVLSKYPASGPEDHPRRFQSSWYVKFSSWLEYSPSKDAAFCLPCFLFVMPNGRPASTTFTVHGFRNWKKVNDGKKCAFLVHMGESHNAAEKSCANLMNPSFHIDKQMNAQTREEKKMNMLRLKTTVDAIQWLTFQSLAFRGHDESVNSRNRGNFIELILANKVREKIHEEIGDAKYCILVDEAKDESRKEQMALVLRFVDNDGFIRESVSSKHNSELQSVQIHEITNMIAIDELETSKGANQIGTLWKTVKEILGITYILCQALQQKSQDILNAMHHLSTTRALVQKLREDGWDSFLETTKSFCEKYEIDVSDMSGLYIMGRGRSCHQKDQITIEHHYQIDLSTATIDSQLQELNSRFSEKTMEFITLSSALDPKDGFK